MNRLAPVLGECGIDIQLLRCTQQFKPSENAKLSLWVKQQYNALTKKRQISEHWVKHLLAYTDEQN